MLELTVAVAHFPGVIGKASANLDRIERLSTTAASQKAGFILFPEDCLTGYPGATGSAATVALEADGPEVRRLADLAAKLNLIISAGYIERRGDTFHSSESIAFPNRQRLTIRKRSVDARDAHIGLTASKDANPDFQILGAKTAMSICMDGTAEFFAGAAERHIQLILHPSGGACARWAHTTDPSAKEIDARESDNCQRCVESASNLARKLNAAYLVANPVGYDGERGYPGNSFIISPSGGVLSHLGPTAIIEHMREAVGVATITLDSQ